MGIDVKSKMKVSRLKDDKRKQLCQRVKELIKRSTRKAIERNRLFKMAISSQVNGFSKGVFDGLPVLITE